MRALVALLLLAGALWQAAADWQATIGQGHAYRLTPIGQILADAAPAGYAWLVAAGKASALPFLWDPIGATLLALPVAPVLGLVALVVWITRRPKR